MSIDILDPGEIGRWIDENDKPADALATHLDVLNRVCRDEGGGIGPAMGWHVVIGGDTGQGKSLLALNFAKDAIAAGERVGFVSLEMSPRQLATRFYAIIRNAEVSSIELGSRYSRTEAEAVQEFVVDQSVRYGDRNFFVSDGETGTDVGKILAKMDEWRSHGVRVFFIDYLQLCSSGDEDSLSQELVKISSAVRTWTHRHKVLTFALSQYSYGASKNVAVRPAYHSLYGSARIGQDADLVLLLDHTRRERTHDRRKSRTWLIIGKNRHGDDGSIPIEWDYSTLRSRQALPDEEGLWPQ